MNQEKEKEKKDRDKHTLYCTCTQKSPLKLTTTTSIQMNEYHFKNTIHLNLFSIRQIRIFLAEHFSHHHVPDKVSNKYIYNNYSFFMSSINHHYEL